MNGELKFPVDWQYRITVLADATNAPEDFIRILRLHGSDTMPVKGNVSKSGKYISWQIPVIFRDRAMMESLSQALGAVDGVKFVL
jgi:putative lipoic acid-binding regulatory protein